MRKHSLTRTFMIFMILLAVLSVGIVGILWTYSEYNAFRKSALQDEQNYMAGKRETLKYEVTRAVDYIEFKQMQAEKRLKRMIRNRTYEAYTIAMNLYLKHRDTLGDEALERIVKDAIRPIWFNRGRGYYFATELNGMSHIFSDKPELEGKNLLDMQSSDGKYVIRDQIDLVNQSGEGYYRYKWTKPGTEGKAYPKIAFVKHFAPFDWYIGTGEYLDEVEKDIQQEVIDRVERIKFGRDGYIFIATYQGMSLTKPVKGKNMYSVTDPNGVKIVQELITAAKSGGGFVNYVMPQFEGVVNAPKLSYAQGIPAWEWYVGAGLYVGEIETVIAQKKADLNKRIQRHIFQILAMLLAAIAVVFILVKLFSGRMKRNLDRFFNAFDNASKQYAKIDGDELEFTEFENLAQSANRMIDARDQAYKEQQESKEWMENILNSIQSGIVVIDAGQHRIVDVNPEAVRMIGAPKEEIVGAVCHKYICPSKRGKCPIIDLKKEVEQKERVLIRADGVETPVIKTVSRAVLGDTDLLIESFIDISEKKQLEAKLWESQKLEAVGALAGGIAHDFNNLMMGVQGRVSLMMEDTDSQHPFHDHLNSIQEYVKNAAALTGQLLGFARGGKYNVEPIDMNEIAQHQVQLFGRTKKEIKMIGQYEKDLWAVEADRGQMVQVLLNLFVNAGQAIPEGGSISVSTQNIVAGNDGLDAFDAPPGRYVKIEVADTGIGMDSATLHHIFDPFFTTKKIGRGTGLGLASVYGIVKNHHGYIRAESLPGEGATFTIWLPASEKKAGAPKNDSTEAARGSGTVLLVDDEEIILDVGSAMLERLGYTVIPARGGKMGIELFSEQLDTIDLVILDMIMPEMSGGDTFDKLKTLDPGAKVILSSGYSIDGEASRILNRGCVGFIQKPFSLQSLSSKITEVLNI